MSEGTSKARLIRRPCGVYVPVVSRFRCARCTPVHFLPQRARVANLVLEHGEVRHARELGIQRRVVHQNGEQGAGRALLRSVRGIRKRALNGVPIVHAVEGGVNVGKQAGWNGH